MSADQAVKAVLEKGQGALMAKVDVRSTYRIIPVHDLWVLGMMWDGSVYVDLALPFGLRSAPKIFNAVADALEWYTKQQGAGTLFHYLDDFLTVGEPASSECSVSVTILLSVIGYLGIPVAMDKLEGLSTCITFLGIEIGTVVGEIRLPEVKVVELQKLIRTWLGRRSCSKQDLQSLIGKVQHACKVVCPGRTFLRRMFELLAVAAKNITILG